MFEKPDRFDRKVDVGFVRELMAHTPSVATSGTHTEQMLPFHQYDILHTQASEMVRDTRTHAHPTNDHHIRSCFHWRRAYTKSKTDAAVVDKLPGLEHNHNNDRGGSN